MNAPWAIRLARLHAPALAPLRLRAGVEIAEDGDSVWARGPTCDDALERLIRGLPAEARFTWGENDSLRAEGSRIPSGRLPAARWRSLSDWLQVVLPPVQAVFPGHERIPLLLVRGGEEREPNLLTTPLEIWRAYALEAPEIRLSYLRFAVSSDGQAAVRGGPCPPLPGVRWVERSGIAVPAGYRWNPNVSDEVVRLVLSVESGGLILWYPDQRISRLREEQFIEVTRPNLRATEARTFHTS